MRYVTDGCPGDTARHVITVRGVDGGVLAVIRLLGLDTLDVVERCALTLAQKIPGASCFDLVDRAVAPVPILTRSVSEAVWLRNADGVRRLELVDPDVSPLPRHAATPEAAA